MPDSLFPLPEPTVSLPQPGDGLSAGQRLTLRNRAQIDRGVHPATLRPLLGDGSTCGDCYHCVRVTNGNRTWIKCDEHRLGISHSEASDIRASWPACTLFVAAEP